jgi:hypothetical protein
MGVSDRNRYSARHGSRRELLTHSQTLLPLTRAEHELPYQAHDRDQYVRALNCLYGVSRLVEQAGNSLEQILQGTVDLIPPPAGIRTSSQHASR